MRRIACKVVGHKLSSIKKCSILIEEYECANYSQKFTTDGYGKIVKLNSYRKENNLLFERLLQKENTHIS